MTIARRTGPDNSDSSGAAARRPGRASDPLCHKPAQTLGSIGSYTLVEQVAQGSQGVVYRAWQTNTKRQVALKRLTAGSLATPTSRARFEREVETTAALKHPNIVTVYGMEMVEGAPLLAMEWIDGAPVNRWALGKDGKPRLVADKLRMFLRICDAVQHAHRNGVIHRDLKPTNILVDSEEQPHLLDFGLAKSLASDAATTVAVTQTGEFVGTPAYAAPEQVRFENEAVDTRTDLYALGVILFEVLTGEFPYEISRNIATLVDTIINVEPGRASRCNPQVGPELDTIVRKALAKDPSQRYQSVHSFAADIRRFLAGEPILAHPPSLAYQLRKLVQRYRLAFVGGAALLLLLIGFGVVSTIQAARLAEQRNTAVKAQENERLQRTIAETKTAEAERFRDLAEQKQRAAEQHAAEAERQQRKTEWQAYVANVAAADAALQAGDSTAAARRLDHAPPHLMNWEWSYLSRLSDRPTGAEVGTGVLVHDRIGATVVALAFNPTATRLVTGTQDGVVTVWRTLTGERLASFAPATSEIRGLVFSPDGSAFAIGAADGTVQLRDGPSGDVLTTWSTHVDIDCIAMGANGRLFLAGCEDGSISAWDIATGRAVARLEAHTARVSALAVSPDGSMLASAGPDATVVLWDCDTLRKTAVIQVGNQAVHALAISPNASRLACGSADGVITLYSLADHRRTAELVGHAGAVHSLDFSPDGTRLLSGSDDATLRLWDPDRREELLTLYGHADPVRAVTFSPDGAAIASGSSDATVRIWKARLSAEELVDEYFENLDRVADVIAFLEADDAMDPALRAVALRIARIRAASSASKPAVP